MAQLRISTTARADIIDVLEWTQTHFGELARQRYERLIAQALERIVADPFGLGSFDLSEFADGLRMLHLRHVRGSGQSPGRFSGRPRHFILYGPAGADIVGVGRILHDSMDLGRHLPSDFGDA